ncbi:MAG: 4'-phosphopantetheinyl transferase superfamily protein [Bacteroidota bacterium]
MPILEIKTLSATRSLVLWNMTESLDHLLDMISLNAAEKGTLKSIKNEIKQKEWLTGRLAIRELAVSMGLNYKGVSKNEFGKPYLEQNNGEISLSHSYPYVAAIYDRQTEVGVDLEQPTPKLKLIAKKFLSDSERNYVGGNITKLCIYWCAKEALYKIYGKRGLIFKENLLIRPFELSSDGVISGSIIVNKVEKKYNLQYNVKQGFVLVYNV